MPVKAAQDLLVTIAHLCKASSRADLASVIRELLLKKKEEVGEGGEDDLGELLDAFLEDLCGKLNALLEELLIEEAVPILPCEQQQQQPSSGNKQKRDVVAPSNLLSISQVRSIYTALEVVWEWSIKPFVDSVLVECGAAEYKDAQFGPSLPKSLMIKAETLACIGTKPFGALARRMDISQTLRHLRCMTAICHEQQLCNFVLERNLGRILFSLLLLSSQTAPGVEQERERMEQQAAASAAATDCLQFITSPIVFENGVGSKAMLISSLRCAASGPLVVAKRACQEMTSILLATGGLEATLQGYLHGITDGAESTPIQAKVAKLVTSIPQGMSKEAYMENFCPQLVHLLVFATKNEDHVLAKVCTLIAHRIAQTCPRCSDELVLRPLALPFLCLCFPSLASDLQSSPYQQQRNMSDESTEASIFGSNAVWSETELCLSTRALLALVTMCPVTPPLSASIHRSGVGQAMINLAMFAVSSAVAKISDVSTTALAFCVEYFVNSGPTATLDMEQTLNDQMAYDFVPVLSQGGSVEVRHRDRRQNDEQEISLSSLLSKKTRSADSTLSIQSLLAGLKPGNQGGNTSGGGGGESVAEEAAFGAEEDIENVLHLAAMASSFVGLGEDDCGQSKHGLVLIDTARRAKAAATLLMYVEEQLQPSFDSSSSSSSSSEASRRSNVAAELFIRSLRGFLQTGGDAAALDKSRCGMLLMVLQGYVPIAVLLRDGAKVIELLESFLVSNLAQLDEDEIHAPAARSSPLIEEVQDTVIPSERRETLSSVLAIFNGMLSLGTSTRSDEEERALKKLLPLIQQVSIHERDPQLAQAAGDIALMLLTRATSNSSSSPLTQTDGNTAIQRALDEMEQLFTSDSPAMRALGVRNIVVALRERSEPLESTEVERTLRLLQSLLGDSESFVYLNSLHAIGVLSIRHRAKVFADLLSVFSSEGEAKRPVRDGAVSSLRSRALVAEALVVVLRRSGQLGAQLVTPLLVAACIRVARIRPLTESEEVVELQVDLRTMKMQSGGAGAEVDEDKIDKAALGADAALLRQSSVSLLAEAMAVAGWGGSRYVYDVLDVAIGILQMETKYSQVARASRRSASFLLRHLISNLDEKLITMENGGELLRSAYKALKLSANDTDSVVAFHSQVALAAIDELVRASLFKPNESIGKIRVL